MAIITNSGEPKKNRPDQEITSFKKPVKSRVGSIIGLPPNVENDPIEKSQLYVVGSMPICRIIPAMPTTVGESSQGLHIFSLDTSSGASKWRDVVSSTGFDVSNSESYLDVAYLNETSISESFTNDFGGSRLEEMGNFSGGLLSELRQMTGSSSAEQALKRLGEKTGDVVGVGKILKGALDMGGSAAGVGENMLTNAGLGRLLSGSKVDFPMIWKNSSYQTSYSITCRLYNPVPNSWELYREKIILPLAKILAFVTPISDPDAITYYTPLLCKVTCPGLWQIRAGFISSVEVIKGGEANDISFRQRPGMIDLRITFGELYGVITTSAEKKDKTYKDRLTLGRYLDVLQQSALDPSVDYYADVDDGFSVADASDIVPSSSGSQSIRPRLDPNSRITQGLNSISKDLQDKMNYPEMTNTLTSIVSSSKSTASGISKSTTNALGGVTTDLLVVGTGLAIGKNVNNDLGLMVAGAGTNSLIGRLNSEVNEDTAKDMSEVTLKTNNIAMNVGGPQSIGGTIADNNDIESGVAESELAAVGNTMTNLSSHSSRTVGTALPNMTTGTRLALIADAVGKGRIIKTGESNPDEVRTSIADTNLLFKNLESTSRKENGSNKVLADLVKALVRLMTGFTPRRSTNPGKLIGILESPTTGLTYEDVVDSSTNLISVCMPEATTNLIMSSPISLRMAIDSICSGLVTSLTSLIAAKRSLTESPDNPSLVLRLDSAKTTFVSTYKGIKTGFPGEVATSMSLGDLVDCIYGNIDDSVSSGLLEAVADAYLDKVNKISGLKGDVNGIYATALAAGADAGTLSMLDAFNADLDDLSNECQTIHDNLTASLTQYNSSR